MFTNKSLPADQLLSVILPVANLGLCTIHSLQYNPSITEKEYLDVHPNVFDCSPLLDDFFALHTLSINLILLSLLTLRLLIFQQPLDVQHGCSSLGTLTSAGLPVYPIQPGIFLLRLFRQPFRHDWTGLMKQVSEALDEMLLLDVQSLNHAKSKV